MGQLIIGLEASQLKTPMGCPIFMRKKLKIFLVIAAVGAVISLVVFLVKRFEKNVAEVEVLGTTQESPSPTPTPKVVIKKIFVPESTSTTTFSPLPTSTSEPQVNIVALCEAKEQQMVGVIASAAYKASADAEENAKYDPLFYEVWMSLQSNLQTMLKNWTVKTLAEYKIYCLEHNGSDTGWSPSSGPFDDIDW